MSIRPPRRARLSGAAALIAGFAVSALTVWHASYAAFSTTTANPTNNWAAGSVVLSDDDSNTAMFGVSNIKPGDSGTKCIAVTSAGTLPSAVKLYESYYDDSNSLAGFIHLTVTQGTGGGFGSCTGFTPLRSGATVYDDLMWNITDGSNYSTGFGNWTPTGSGSDTRVFQFHWSLDPACPNSVQGGLAVVAFTWEAQNT